MPFADDIRRPFKSGNVLMQLIIINIVVFAVLNIIRIGFFFTGYSGNVLDAVFHVKVIRYIGMPMNIHEFLEKPWTLITYFFSQVGIGHILWNMIFLYFFGSILQEFIGYSRTLAIYIYSGIIGGLLSLLAHSVIPALIPYSFMPLIGASGSVMGMVVAAGTLVPHKRLFLFIIGEVQLVYVVAFYVIVDLVGVTYVDGIGHICHLGGALTGFLFIRSLQNGRDFSKPFNRLFYGAKRIITFKRKPVKMKVVKNVYTTSTGRNTAASESKIQIQRRIDSILDKISKGGYESLTKEEKDYLFTHGKDI